MIIYSVDGFALSFIFKYRGSVFPKAACWAIPNATLAAVLHTFLHEDIDSDKQSTGGVSILWSGYTFVLGFLIVFLSNQAYSRFWEGATLINQVRGTWFNAVSNLVAFCSCKDEKIADVEEFQHIIVRLASLLYCSALQQICDLPDDTLEIIEVERLDKSSLDYLQGVNDRCEILLQWMQRMIVEAHTGHTLNVAAPILSRVFQELSNGIVALNNVRKIKDIPFPFPYAQLVTWLLLIHFGITPFLASQAIASPFWAAIMCFFVTSSLWSLLYIAHQIDQPFGADDNDLPIDAMQKDFNRSLLQLLEPLAQRPPQYRHAHRKTPMLVASTAGLDTTVKQQARRPSLLGDFLGLCPTPSMSPRPSYHYGEEGADQLREELSRRMSQMEENGETKKAISKEAKRKVRKKITDVEEEEDEGGLTESSDSESSDSESSVSDSKAEARDDATRVSPNGDMDWEPLPSVKDICHSICESEDSRTEVLNPPFVIEDQGNACPMTVTVSRASVLEAAHEKPVATNASIGICKDLPSSESSVT